MTQTHPITPPPELRRQWLNNDHFPMVTGTNDLLSITGDRLNSVMDQAVQWGADQELAACLGYAGANGLSLTRMQAARRPKPPTRKERALKALDGLALPDDAFETICFALEQLND